MLSVFFTYSFKPKLSVLIVTLFFIFLNNGANAQVEILDKKFTATYKAKALKEVLSDITSKTTIRFSYSPKKIPEETMITTSFVNYTVNEALQLIFKTLPITYALVDNYIVLKQRALERVDVPVLKTKNVTFCGYIKDNETAEFLIGASIFIRELNEWAGTNNYGFFSVTVPPGKYTVEVSYIGYAHVLQNIDLVYNVKADFAMKYQSQKIDEITIAPFQKEVMITKMHAGQTNLSPEFIAQQPSFMGETDAIKSLEFIPGVCFSSDGSSYFHVRGGNYDQNLIIIDEATLFNPSHLLGLFSPIIPDAIKSVDIYKADYPINYGGRLSSIIDINTRDGDKSKFTSSGTLGLIAARATLEGPIKKDESSYFVSFRRSYFDAYLKPSVPSLLGLYFYDFTSKLNIKMGHKDRLFVTLYKSEDILRDKINADDSNGINWENSSFTLRWNHVFGSRLFLNSSLITSKYDYYVYASINSDIYWNSRIANSSLKEELSFYQSPELTMKFGMKLARYDFNPGNYYNPLINNYIQVSPVNSQETTLYAGAEHQIASWLKLNYGMRLTGWSNYGKAFVLDLESNADPKPFKMYGEKQKFYNHTTLEPRISLSLITNYASNLKVSYSRTTQFLNLISNSVSPFNSLEVWLPSGPNIKPQLSDIIDIGYIRLFSLFTMNTDIFYKFMQNQIGYQNHANMLVNPALEAALRQGDGKAYGFEVSIRKESGKFTGQLAYSFSRSFLKIKDVNDGRIFPASYDKPHVFTINLAWNMSYRWFLSSDYSLSSGSRFTSPTSFYNYQGYQVPVYNEMNNDHLPLYHRFDVAVRCRLNGFDHRFNHSLTFGILNFFNVRNPILVNFNKIKDEDGNFVIPMDKLNLRNTVSTIRYTYSLSPSLTYQFKF